jgi:hypothetical protein
MGQELRTRRCLTVQLRLSDFKNLSDALTEGVSIANVELGH